MSTTYEVQKGDTFEKIALRFYGDASKANDIRDHNPGVSSLSVGSEIVVPVDKLTPLRAPKDIGVSVAVDGKVFTNWASLVCRKAVDSLDTVALVCPFDSERQDLRQVFTPFTYKDVVVHVEGVLFFTGTVVSVRVDNDAKAGSRLSIEAYSKPGVLQDCCAPISSLPLEFENADLSTIAKKMAGIYGVNVQFDPSPTEKYGRVEYDFKQSILSFLSKLAIDSGFVIGSTPAGALDFRRYDSKTESKTEITEGLPAGPVSISSSFLPQEFYSEITAAVPMDTGGVGSKSTIANPFLKSPKRVYNFSPEDLEDNATTEWVFAYDDFDGEDKSDQCVKAAKNHMSRMFANAIRFIVAGHPFWYDASGSLIKPGDCFDLTAPSVMVYKKFKFLARSVVYYKTASSSHVDLELVVPESFSSEIPKDLPWL